MSTQIGPELPDDIYDRIIALSEQGNELADEDEYERAEAVWAGALTLLPEPAVEWEPYTWLWASIGDVRYLTDDTAGATEAFFNALNGPGGVENPWIHYMLGKSLVSADRADRAADELMRAYMLDDDLFHNDEDEGERMLKILRDAGARLD
ncbi:tetratricopeptide repeat protein [Leucobacter weissii]|uniref:Tetratricopeptide repeat protein n=1 Tax=Leucobacter weissii TaxID=1983706 RepID=A0A939MQK7_9MICO|nr:tetratricopeptide repeat protein [Leucobacter weissii]MBO1903122.1 tetratricopeptide repeat protein [Leucobacter weissii]